MELTVIEESNAPRKAQLILTSARNISLQCFTTLHNTSQHFTTPHNTVRRL